MCFMNRTTPSTSFFELLGGAVDVRVVLGEVAHAEQAVQHATHLVAVDTAQLCHAQRQVTVASAGGSCR